MKRILAAGTAVLFCWTTLISPLAFAAGAESFDLTSGPGPILVKTVETDKTPSDLTATAPSPKIPSGSLYVYDSPLSRPTIDPSLVRTIISLPEPVRPIPQSAVPNSGSVIMPGPGGNAQVHVTSGGGTIFIPLADLGLTPKQWIQSLYINILGREGDEDKDGQKGGVTYWTERFDEWLLSLGSEERVRTLIEGSFRTCTEYLERVAAAGSTDHPRHFEDSARIFRETFNNRNPVTFDPNETEANYVILKDIVTRLKAGESEISIKGVLHQTYDTVAEYPVGIGRGTSVRFLKNGSSRFTYDGQIYASNQEGKIVFSVDGFPSTLKLSLGSGPLTMETYGPNGSVTNIAEFSIINGAAQLTVLKEGDTGTTINSSTVIRFDHPHKTITYERTDTGGGILDLGSVPGTGYEKKIDFFAADVVDFAQFLSFEYVGPGPVLGGRQGLFVDLTYPVASQVSYEAYSQNRNFVFARGGGHDYALLQRGALDLSAEALTWTADRSLAAMQSSLRDDQFFRVGAGETVPLEGKTYTVSLSGVGQIRFLNNQTGYFTSCMDGQGNVTVVRPQTGGSQKVYLVTIDGEGLVSLTLAPVRRTYYAGPVGHERLDYEQNVDSSGRVTTTLYFYGDGKRAAQASVDASLTHTGTYLGGTAGSDTVNGLRPDSQTFYTGAPGEELKRRIFQYDGNRNILSTTVFNYSGFDVLIHSISYQGYILDGDFSVGPARNVIPAVIGRGSQAGFLSIQFHTLEDEKYQVQYSTSLQSWANAGSPVEGFGPLLTVQVPIEGTSGFFRVLQLPKASGEPRPVLVSPPAGDFVLNSNNNFTSQRSVDYGFTIFPSGSTPSEVRFSLDDGRTWTAWETYQQTRTLELSDRDGIHSIQAQLRSASGFVNTFVDTVTLDRVPPSGSVTINNGNRYTHVPEVYVAVSSWDDLSVGQVEETFSQDGIHFSPATISVPLNGDPPFYRINLEGDDGEKTLYVRLRDEAGNIATFSRAITLERTPPQGSISLSGYPSNDYFYDFPVRLDLNATDDVSGVSLMRFSLDGGSLWTDWESYKTQRTISGEEARTLYDHYGTPTVVFSVEYKDFAGNVKRESFTSTQDGALPIPAFEISGGGPYARRREVTFDLTVQETLSGVRGMAITPSVDENGFAVFGPLEPFATPKVITLPEGDGVKMVHMVACSAVACAYHSQAITLDTTPPAGTVAINNNDAYTNQATVALTLNVSDATSGVDQMRFSVDGGTTWTDWETYAATKSLDLPAGEGEKTVQFQARDKAGNLSAILTDSIILNTTQLLADQNLQTNQEVRKTMILGPVADGTANPITYSYSASSNLMSNGQFSLLKNQLTYSPANWFTGSGDITVQFTESGTAKQYVIHLGIAAPQITTPNDPSLSNQYGLTRTNALRAWNLSRGAGVNVAILDTGINGTHGDLSNSIFTNSGEIAGDGIDNDGNGFVDDAYGWDFVNGDNDPADDNGHGTHVGGIVAAQSGNGQGGSGIAPDAKLIPVKVLDSDSGGSTINSVFQKVAQGILYAVQAGAQVINLSLAWVTSGIGASIVQAVKDALNAAHEAGVVVVAAAGNDNLNAGNYAPAALNNVIAVSATNGSDLRATNGGSYFSNYGSAIDLAAPGADIYSTGLSGYAYETGTSMAAPFVAGLSAMILAQDATATPDDVYRRLKFSPVDLGSPGFDNYFGYGRIDAFRALSYDYSDTGVIKTQWLETPDENGWNRLSFDAEGYLTGGTYAAVSGIAGLGAALGKALAPASQSIASSPLSSSSGVSVKQSLKLRGVDLRRAGTRDQLKKVEKEDDSVTPKAPILLPNDSKENNRSQGSSSRSRRKNSFNERLSSRTEIPKQEMISYPIQKFLALATVRDGLFAGAASYPHLPGAAPVTARERPRL